MLCSQSRARSGARLGTSADRSAGQFDWACATCLSSDSAWINDLYSPTKSSTSFDNPRSGASQGKVLGWAHSSLCATLYERGRRVVADLVIRVAVWGIMSLAVLGVMNSWSGIFRAILDQVDHFAALSSLWKVYYQSYLISHLIDSDRLPYLPSQLPIKSSCQSIYLSHSATAGPRRHHIPWQSACGAAWVYIPD